MNWFDNVSSDCDQPIAAACLMHGHWRHQRNPFTDPVLCRVVLDVAEPRVVAAQVIEHGMVEDLDSTELEDLTQALVSQNQIFTEYQLALVEIYRATGQLELQAFPETAGEDRNLFWPFTDQEVGE